METEARDRRPRGLALASPAPRAQDAKAPAKAVEVPFELLGSKHMVVKAKLNGKGPFRLVFDLGSPVTLLSNDAARKAGVIDADAPRSFLFAARGEAEVKALTVGDLEAEGVPVWSWTTPRWAPWARPTAARSTA